MKLKYDKSRPKDHRQFPVAQAYMTLSIEHCHLLKIVKGVKKSICEPQGIGLPYAIPVLKLSIWVLLNMTQEMKETLSLFYFADKLGLT